MRPRPNLNLKSGLTVCGQSTKIPETIFRVDPHSPAVGRGTALGHLRSGKAMPKRVQTHEIVSRHRWLGHTPKPIGGYSVTTAGTMLRTLEAADVEVLYRHARFLAPDALRAMSVR